MAALFITNQNHQHRTLVQPVDTTLHPWANNTGDSFGIAPDSFAFYIFVIPIYLGTALVALY